MCLTVYLYLWWWCLSVQSQQTPVTELCEDPLIGPAESVEEDDQQAFLSEISEEDVEVLRQREEALLQIEVCTCAPS